MNIVPLKPRTDKLKELIEQKVTHLDLFNYYYPGNFKPNRPCKNVLSHKDENPSMVIYNRNGGVFFKCYNSPQKGDIWKFLMEYFNLSFSESVNMVAKDFGLLENCDKKFQKVLNELPVIKKTISKPPEIKAVNYKEFPERHLKYLQSYHLTPEDMNFCEDTKVFALKDFYINKKKFSVRSDEVGFIYLVNNKFIKIYLPERPKGEKWWSNIPFTHIHGLDNLKNCKVGFLTKSIKDGAVIKKFISPHVAIIQAENISSITSKDAEIIKNSVENLYIIMDNDKTGKEASYAFCDLLNAKHINVPDKYFPESTDFADMVKNIGINSVINHFNEKTIYLSSG